MKFTHRQSNNYNMTYYNKVWDFDALNKNTLEYVFYFFIFKLS